MDTILESAIKICSESELSFCKFISPNDCGLTGAHQCGIYIPKQSYKLLFDEPGIKGTNRERSIKIKWQDKFYTESRFKYYGKKTRNEYRITKFGRGFPYLKDKHLGDLFIICKKSEDFYVAYMLESEKDINNFLSNFNLSPVDTNSIIKINHSIYNIDIDIIIKGYISSLTVDFPSTQEISDEAQNILFKFMKKGTLMVKNPDSILIELISMEYKIFKAIENDRYKYILTKPFNSIQDFITCANTLLNRRKSRAGKSLEHHLKTIFIANDLRFTEQAITEQNKKPDFIFPGQEEYHNLDFDNDKLISLAAKTTCKDRWRQILNEADRIRIKHLVTLQQGISSNQLNEMRENNVILVVPAPYIKTYPKEFQDKIMSLKDFIEYAKKISAL
ncbi:type II restriction endonuclease [Clostridium tyrobutyricum]|uniref:type II restriction endonuclease n=1 Tax=Clostridium tyrobutyricum TaxID=1519 RepID=UPI001C3905D4|nr:type II restriction endonuclease [Clostridium tyrobutyricum]MBV4414667.1 type II restriction endonuclease [Clostridium tyrobutyricum]